MAKVNTNIKYTYEDYKNLPESETERYELLEGELVMVPSPGEYHQCISGNLMFILQGFVRGRGLGVAYSAPLNVVLGEEEDRKVVQPDVIFVSRGRSHIISEDEVRGAPDLVVEIASPLSPIQLFR
ncbi:MAG: Uma2 family endonuclease [bacterium]